MEERNTVQGLQVGVKVRQIGPEGSGLRFGFVRSQFRIEPGLVLVKGAREPCLEVIAYGGALALGESGWCCSAKAAAAC